VKYFSTRGTDNGLGFGDVLLAGLARDGGLYVPEHWPQIPGEEIRQFSDKPYAAVAFEIVRRFIGGDIEDDALEEMTRLAYARFDHEAVAPLVLLEPNRWLLELFHGPTLAFKDLAMQLLARLMDHVLNQRGKTVTIVVATSGDTGGAAAEAFRGLDRVNVFILHPHGRVSEVQRRQMTCVSERNIHNIALEGTFDDAQAIVKGLFNDLDLRDQLDLAGVNSINWARVMAQIVYYFTAAAKLGAPERRVSFTVPTGNFGDIYAGFAARRMGLGVDRLVIATNVNDILVRTLSSGVYELSKVVATTSSSMDIQISSNFERLLFDAYEGDSQQVIDAMDRLAGAGKFELEKAALARIKAAFDAGRSDETEIAATMARVYKNCGRLIDPHTAVGLSIAPAFESADVPMVALATAHPAKFPDAVEAACGVRPQLPARLSDLMERRERFSVIENDLSAVAAHITARAGR
jgi:threonine synthase